MTTPTPESVKALADGLTKAGRIILCRMRPDIESEAYYLRSSVDVWAPAATLASLIRRRLVKTVKSSAPQRYILTPLGILVREYLGASHA